MSFCERIISRKIEKSLGRHFSKWKLREFTITGNSNLSIKTLSSQKTLVCPLRSLKIKHHYYSSQDQPFNLSLKCILSDEETEKELELLLRFDNMERMSSFESVN